MNLVKLDNNGNESFSNINEIKNELMFKAKRTNWTCHSNMEWESVEWAIFADKMVKKTTLYGNGQKHETENALLNIQYQQLLNLINIKDCDFFDKKIEACDGEGWSMTVYKDNKIYWNRPMDYIYGIDQLEQIADFLLSVCDKHPDFNSLFY